MKQYNRALDWVALALNELGNGKHALAAKLLAKARAEPDCNRAIEILEASNKQAFEVAAAAAKVEAAKIEAAKAEPKKPAAKVGASKRIKASEEMVEDFDVEQDPLDEIEDDEDEGDLVDDETDPTEEMASVLARMVRRSK
jgi:hypothetical protein